MELFELPMLLGACGYKIKENLLNQLQTFLQESKYHKLDVPALIAVLTQLKQLELADEIENEGDEYLDAFVALGGSPDKEGSVHKNTLIEIIKQEFELTIDMVVSTGFLSILLQILP